MVTVMACFMLVQGHLDMSFDHVHWLHGVMPVCRCLAADFSKNGIGQMGITRLIEALKHNDCLETLVLDTNSVGDEGAEALAQYMAGETHSSLSRQACLIIRVHWQCH